MGNIPVTNGPFTALEKIAGSFYVVTMKSDKIHLDPRPAFCKGDKLLKWERGGFSDCADAGVLMGDTAEQTQGTGLCTGKAVLVGCAQGKLSWSK